MKLYRWLFDKFGGNGKANNNKLPHTVFWVLVTVVFFFGIWHMFDADVKLIKVTCDMKCNYYYGLNHSFYTKDARCVCENNESVLFDNARFNEVVEITGVCNQTVRSVNAEYDPSKNISNFYYTKNCTSPFLSKLYASCFLVLIVVFFFIYKKAIEIGERNE